MLSSPIFQQLNHKTMDSENLKENATVPKQYLLFESGQKELYGINVSKVEGLIIYSELNVAQSNRPDGLMLGKAKVREQMVTLVSFDRWLNKPDLPNDAYELVMLCDFGGRRFGLVIRSVFGVRTLNEKQIHVATENDEKMAYIAEIDSADGTRLCHIFDSDRLLTDIYPEILHYSLQNRDTKIEWNQKGTVYLAEDSAVMRVAVEDLLREKGIPCDAFANGRLLLEALKREPERCALIITDMEMPEMDGMELIHACKENRLLSDIPIIVNSNMANSSLVKKSKDAGASDVIVKFDPVRLLHSIVKVI